MTMKMPQPTSLVGKHVVLEPLAEAHLPDLFEAGGRDEEVWRWLPPAAPQTLEELAAIYAEVARNQAEERLSPFAVISREHGKAVGWTTYMDVPTFDESLEIGWTWYGRAVWRTAVNTECKLLLLSHGFELGYDRLVLKTDHLNTRSQAAIARLGAKYEGTLRHHWRRRDGSWRDTVLFSILAEEWPEAKRRLEERLARG